MKIKSSKGEILTVPDGMEEAAFKAQAEGKLKEFADGLKERMKSGGMIKRKDGSYSRRGLWDNIRANRGSGRKPTKEMLKQEAKIRAEHGAGGTVFKGYVTEQPMSEPVPFHTSTIGEKMGKGGYTVKRSSARKGKTHVVIGPDGTKKYFGDSKLGQHPKDPARKKSFYARHKHNLAKNPYFRAFARATWAEGGKLGQGIYDMGLMPYGDGGYTMGNMNPDGLIHIPYGYATPAYNERYDFGGWIKDAGKLGLNTLAAPLEQISGNNFVNFKYDNKLMADAAAVSEGIIGAGTDIAGSILAGPAYGMAKSGVQGVTKNIGTSQEGQRGANKWANQTGQIASSAGDLTAGIVSGNAQQIVGGAGNLLGTTGQQLGSKELAGVGQLAGTASMFVNPAAGGGNSFFKMPTPQMGSPIGNMMAQYGGAIRMDDGGQTGMVPINVEGANFSQGSGPDAKKGELLVKNGKIIKNYVGRPPHPEEGQNPMGNDEAPEGLIVIPKNRTAEYLEAGLVKRKQMEASLVSQQQDREMKKMKRPSKKMGDGGYYSFGGDETGMGRGGMAYSDQLGGHDYAAKGGPIGNPETIDSMLGYGYKKGGWIQKATASIKRRGTEGVCTGSKFGGPTCPPGSRRYNLAKTFKKMARARHEDGGYTNPDSSFAAESWISHRNNPDYLRGLFNTGIENPNVMAGITGANDYMKNKLVLSNPEVLQFAKYGVPKHLEGSLSPYDLSRIEKAKNYKSSKKYGGMIDPVTGSHHLLYAEGGQLPESLLRTRMRASGASPEEINNYVAAHYADGGETKMPDMKVEYGKGGGIYIKPANRGKFTAWAKSHGMGVQEAAQHVMAHKDKYSSTIVKRANFARNAARWKHEMGGPVNVDRSDIYEGLRERAEYGGRLMAEYGMQVPYASAGTTPTVTTPSYLTPGGGYGDIYDAAAANATQDAWKQQWHDSFKAPAQAAPSTPTNWSNVGQDIASMAPIAYNLGRGIFEKPVHMNASDYMSPEMSFRATRFDQTPYETARSRAAYGLRQTSSGPGYRAGLAATAAGLGQAESQDRLKWQNAEAERRQAIDQANAEINARNKGLLLQTDIMNQQNRAARNEFFAKSAEELSQEFGRNPRYYEAIKGDQAAYRPAFSGWRTSRK